MDSRDWTEPELARAIPTDLYMVWTRTGWAPRRKHPTLEAAATEAARLARLYPGKTFFVLEAVLKFHATVPSCTENEHTHAVLD